MENPKKYKLRFYLFLNVAIILFVTFSSYSHLPLNTVKDYVFYLIHFLLLQFSVFGFIYLLTLNKYGFNLFFPLLFLVFALFSFGIYTLDISPTDAIIKATIESKPDIIMDLISMPVVAYIIVVLFVVYFLLKFYNKYKIYEKPNKALLFVGLLGVISFFVIENYRYNTFKSRMPYNLVFGIYEYYQKPEMKITPISKNLKSKIDTLHIIVVLGESLRADHLHINGYLRKTTPHLDTLKNLVSFKNIFTPLTYTAVSLPQILTNQSIYADSIEQPVYSIYTIADRINFNTIWIGNQTPEKSYDLFIKENDEYMLIDSLRSSTSFMKKKDEKLLPYFKNKYKQSQKELITIHMIGSHWWYENRYSNSFRIFKPVIKSKFVPSNTSEEMINSYDNTILYMDNFMNEIIKNISDNDNTIVIFISDHGENLGEDGRWLHAQGGKAAENPAVFIWFTNKFKAKFPDSVKNMFLNKNKKISTNFFYNSILDLYQLQDFQYNKKESIFGTNLN